MPVPFLDLKAQYLSLKPEIDDAIQGVINSSTFALGPAVERFEHEYAHYCAVPYCIGVNSGTAALELLLRAYDIGPGDEVLTVANTFFATVEAIALVGATPVLVDCAEVDALIDVEKLERAVTPKTAAIIPVHLYGQCADMDPIMAIAQKHNLTVIEDACQAHGSTYKGRKAGSLGHAAAFSFYPGKNLGAFGEAGAVMTDNKEIAKKIRMLRDHGMLTKYHHELIGYNERMDGIQGSILSVKLKHLEEWNAQRREHVRKYRVMLNSVMVSLPAGQAGSSNHEAHGDIQFFEEKEGRKHNYHLFVIRVPNRNRVQEKLRKNGINTGIHYPIPIHKQPAFRGHGWDEGPFPVSEKLAGEILSLPMFPEMTEKQIEEVCDALKEALEES